MSDDRPADTGELSGNSVPAGDRVGQPNASDEVSAKNELAEQHDELSAAQGTENFIETYHAISEWIRFADAKAAVILTVGGALAGFLIPTIHRVISPEEVVAHLFPGWQIVCLVLFGLYMLFFLTSGILSFMCINPLRSKGRHPSLDHCDHFHPAAISSAYRDDEVERFCERLRANGDQFAQTRGSGCHLAGQPYLKQEIQPSAAFVNSLCD